MRITPFKDALYSRPENAMLIALARARLDDENAEALKKLVEGKVDWAYLIKAAYNHGVMPLVYRNLSAACADAAPDQVMRELQSSCHEIALFNIFLTGELINLLNAFKSQHVPAVSFKGPVLARYLYGSISLRHFSDIDILIGKQDISKAGAVLVERGYQSQFNISRAQEAIFADAYCQHAFISRERMMAVDLHWSFIPPRFSFAPDTDQVWKRLGSLDLNGNSVSTLAAEDLCELLCIHGAKHAWGQLNWLCDLAELVRLNENIDWELLVNRASTKGSARMISLGLYLARDLLQAPLKEATYQKIRNDAATKRLADRVYEMLFLSVKGKTSINQDRVFLKSMDRFKDRVRFCLDYARPTPLEWGMLSLPRPLHFIYYLLRPIRLTAKHALKRTDRAALARGLNG